MLRRVCVALLLVVGFSGFLGLASGADSNLMGWWKLDGDTQDSSGNNRHGTIQGNAQFVPGFYGQALSFDGDDYVSIDGEVHDGYQTSFRGSASGSVTVRVHTDGSVDSGGVTSLLAICTGR